MGGILWSRCRVYLGDVHLLGDGDLGLLPGDADDSNAEAYVPAKVYPESLCCALRAGPQRSRVAHSFGLQARRFTANRCRNLERRFS